MNLHHIEYKAMGMVYIYNIQFVFCFSWPCVLVVVFDVLNLASRFRLFRDIDDVSRETFGGYFEYDV